MSDQELFGDPADIRHVIGVAGTFSLHNVSGDVDVRGNDTDEVRVVASSSQGNRSQLPLVVRRSEGGLHIQVEQQSPELFGFKAPRGTGSIDFEVSVPHGARVEINGVSSDIEAVGLGGDQSYRSVSGDIDVAGHGGRIVLTTVSGNVELSADKPMSADVTSTSGDVEIAAPLLTNLQLKTVSGDTQIGAGFAAGPVHSIESVSGDLTVRSLTGLTIEFKRAVDMAGGGGRALVFGDGSAQLRFRSLSGDVELDSGRSTSMAGPAPTQHQSPPPPTEGSLEILQALERGEIDVDEATRRLEGASNRG